MIWFYKIYYQFLMDMVVALSNLVKRMSKTITKIAQYIANQVERRLDDY